MKLFSFEHRWLASIFSAILPSNANETLPIGADQVPMRAFIDDLMGRSPLEFNAGFRACIWALTLAPILVLRRPKLFGSLDVASQLRVLDAMTFSDIYVIRELPVMMKMVACLGFGGVPEVQARIGVEPPMDSPPQWLADARALDGGQP